MASGPMRSIISEQASLDFRVLGIDLDIVGPQAIIEAVKRITLQQLLKEKSLEREVCLSGGKTYINRLVRADALNDAFIYSHDTEPMMVTSEDRIVDMIYMGKVVF
ncbi:hypothetical protein F5Y19DRAFT_315483 [Xylariaceae sp. FL1651]|nr:hypothetical protein F5Y19DRAFT_315483 [Xylariaceae sp. FL1651]